LQHHGLKVRRVVFTGGSDPLPHLKKFKVGLFLSNEEATVSAALNAGISAGLIHKAASMILVPTESLRRQLQRQRLGGASEAVGMARLFDVSPEVMLRRLQDASCAGTTRGSPARRPPS
jgi:hypothetical protein